MMKAFQESAEIDTTSGSFTSFNDVVNDEEQTTIRMLVLGLRALYEVRSMCLQSIEYYRSASGLKSKADQIYNDAECHRHRHCVRNATHPVDGSITRLKEKFQNQRGFRNECSAQNRVRAAYKELMTAYAIMNSAKKNSNTRTTPNEMDA